MMACDGESALSSISKNEITVLIKRVLKHLSCCHHVKRLSRWLDIQCYLGNSLVLISK